MASGGYQVEVNALLKGAKAYHADGSNVAQLLKQWQEVARLDSSVFGNLAVSAQMAQGYEKFFSQITKDITALYQQLQKGSESLAKSAATYWMTEHLLTTYLQFLHEVKQDNKYLNLVDSGQEP
jgi:uncharacterized phage infection (PIP) family protein YhgE